ncbi:ABC transporter substrate-binding protein [Cohnella silvisoli]|uniref:ABC transporter substrate-binding protein n=1 Tax=Cohnella silvisoli TaxID=2873699 RepID=A0ABV1KRL3_9BACL|nr:ABC transporter substrate-binding protein [Cohnella silvisoli]MCD9024513.1 ABC transporter substrate-binding protein [Cohnella silvisoli]
MKQRLSVLLLLMLALVLVVSACGSSSNNKEGASSTPSPSTPASQSTEASSTPEPPKDPVEVTLAGWGASPEEQALLQQVLDEFQSKNPDVKVKYEVIADQYMDVIKTRLIGNEAPDVFYLDAFEAPALIAKDVLEPLDGYVTPEFDTNDFEAPMLDAFKSPDGKMYGFPKDYSTLALFYNKKMFADAGIAAPPATWDELQSISAKLTKKKGNKVEAYGLGQAPELARQMFMIKAFGGKLADDQGMASFATPEAEKGLALVVDQHNVAKTAGQPSDVGAGWGGEMLGQQKAAMVLEGNWAIPYLQSNFKDVDFATAEVPSVNGQKGTMAFTVAYVMNKSSEKKEAAWKLISYLTGKEGMKTWTSKGFALPTRKSVAAELGFDKDPLRGALVAGASYATPWQAGTTLPTIMNNFNNQFVAAYTGQSSLTDALKKGQETANKEIKAAQ